jgi:hypothetical protein
MGNNDGQEDNTEPAVDDGRVAYAEDACAREDKDGDHAKAEAERGCDVSSGVKAGCMLVGGWGEEGDVMVKRQVVPQDERSSDGCLHCEINEVVQEHIDGLETVNIAELAGRIAESLVDLILLAPEEEHAQLLAMTITQLGDAFLGKSNEGDGRDRPH